MKNLVTTCCCALVLLLFTAGSCEDKKDLKNEKTLRALFEEYKFGQIEQCTYDGQTVYHAGINAFDAGSQVYDENGRSIAVCNYATSMVDAPCEKLSDCEAIYRCQNHISGKPAVDKFGLAK